MLEQEEKSVTIIDSDIIRLHAACVKQAAG